MVQTPATEATQALNSFWPKVAEDVKTLTNVNQLKKLNIYISLTNKVSILLE